MIYVAFNVHILPILLPAITLQIFTRMMQEFSIDKQPCGEWMHLALTQKQRFHFLTDDHKKWTIFPIKVIHSLIVSPNVSERTYNLDGVPALVPLLPKPPGLPLTSLLLCSLASNSVQTMPFDAFTLQLTVYSEGNSWKPGARQRILYNHAAG